MGNKKKNIVVVVDMLDGFIRKGNLANPAAEKVIMPIRKLIERKKRQGWEIYFLADNHGEEDAEFKMFPKHCVIGTDETKVIKELAEFVSKENYIAKTRYSGLYKTWLEDITRILNPNEIIVVGIYADICVLYTAADLRNRDYKVTIPKDCTMTLAGNDEVMFAHMEKILGVNVVEIGDKL